MTQPSISPHARDLHEGSIVIDAHSDILMAVADSRVHLGERTIVEGVTTRDVRGHYDLPRWKEGGVTAQVCALFIRHNEIHYALTRAIDMIAEAYHEIAETEGLVQAYTPNDIRNAKEQGKVALMLSFEGVDPLGYNLKLLPVFHRLGVRMASLTHARRNYFAGGVMRGDIGEDGGLTPMGVEAIKMMNELGIVIDVRHLDAKSITQVMEVSTQPVVFSHVNAREAFPLDPNADPHFPFTKVSGIDRQKILHDIAASGGVICIIFWRQKDIDGIIDDMEYVAEQVGPEYIGLGTDLYGFDKAPDMAEDVSKFPYITEKLIQRGFTDEQIKGILGDNLMHVFDQVIGNGK